MSKFMHQMNAAELEELIAKLKDIIRRDPNHSRLEQSELQDAEQWLRERKMQQHAGEDEDRIVV